MRRVLVIEDDPVMRSLLSKMLVKSNYVVDAAQNGMDALHQFDIKNYDLVITDIFMPEMDGYESIMNFRKKAPELPIIAISAGDLLSAKNCLEYAKELGADSIILKPIHPKVLIEEVKKLIG